MGEERGKIRVDPFWLAMIQKGLERWNRRIERVEVRRDLRIVRGGKK